MKAICFVTMILTAAVTLAQTQPDKAGSQDNGKRLFLRDGCWECHGYAGQGSRDGVRIASTALSAAQFTRYIRRPAGAMPAYIDKVLSDSEAVDIWTYLKAFPAPKPAKDIPLLNELKGQ